LTNVKSVFIISKRSFVLYFVYWMSRTNCIKIIHSVLSTKNIYRIYKYKFPYHCFPYTGCPIRLYPIKDDFSVASNSRLPPSTQRLYWSTSTLFPLGFPTCRGFLCHSHSWSTLSPCCFFTRSGSMRQSLSWSTLSPLWLAAAVLVNISLHYLCLPPPLIGLVTLSCYWSASFLINSVPPGALDLQRFNWALLLLTNSIPPESRSQRSFLISRGWVGHLN